MKSTCLASLAWLVSTAMLACGEAAAQARGAVSRSTAIDKDPVVERIAKLAELDTWLRRLKGKFRITTQSGQAIGEADCMGIGEGPGVHCIYRMSRGRKDRWTVQVRLFGLNLEQAGVDYLRLNGDSTAEGGTAKLIGDLVIFLGDCPIIQPPQTGMVVVTMTACRQELKMHAAPGGKPVRINTRVTQGLLVSSPQGISRTTATFEYTWLLESVAATRGRK